MRNILLVTGPFADGKTVLINRLIEEMRSRDISFDPRIITDTTYLLEAIDWDHIENSGRHHMHSENGYPGIHSHEEEKTEPPPFVAASPVIQEYMFRRFFEELSKPSDYRWQFAELAGGRNIHDATHPASRNDYSYFTMVRKLEAGTYQTGWIGRVAHVIHPEVPDFEQRIKFNNRRKLSVPTSESVKDGSGSMALPDVVMKNTGEDDFPIFQHFLEQRGLYPNHIENIENADTSDFFDRAVHILERHGVFQPEGAPKGKEVA